MWWCTWLQMVYPCRLISSPWERAGPMWHQHAACNKMEYYCIVHAWTSSEYCTEFLHSHENPRLFNLCYRLPELQFCELHTNGSGTSALHEPGAKFILKQSVVEFIYFVEPFRRCSYYSRVATKQGRHLIADIFRWAFLEMHAAISREWPLKKGSV